MMELERVPTSGIGNIQESVTATPPNNDSPGVQFPPPIVYVAAIAIGWLFNRVRPLPVGGGLPRVLAAWAFVVLWVAITGTAFYAFWSRRTSIVPIRPATTLVVAGTYRFTRNPMYVALGSLTVGIGLWMNTWWVILLLCPAVNRDRPIRDRARGSVPSPPLS